MSYDVTLPREPAAKPNGSYKGPVWTFQLSIAPWFGMVMCDTQSWPEGGAPCRADSDKNIQVPPAPDHAGAAYMELQLYPPGYSPRPFLHKISCDRNHWCSALTIDSLQFNFDFSNQNLNCAEPVNFAFLTRDGKPVGPPGPDQADQSTFTPTPDVLLMNRGDRLHIEMHDTAKGFVTTDRRPHHRPDRDHAGEHRQRVPPHQLGSGGAHVHRLAVRVPPDVRDVHTYTHIATAQNQPMTWAGWTAHTWNVAYQMEIGHFEKKDGDSDDALLLRRADHPGVPRDRRRLRRLPVPQGLAERVSELPDADARPFAGQHQPERRAGAVQQDPVRDGHAGDRGIVRPHDGRRAAPTRPRAPSSTPGST